MELHAVKLSPAGPETPLTQNDQLEMDFTLGDHSPCSTTNDIGARGVHRHIARICMQLPDKDLLFSTIITTGAPA